MKTLVLGGSGFLGSAFTRKNQDREDYYFLQNTNDVPTKKGQKVYGSIADKEVVQKISKMKFEAVIDFSWQGLPDLSTQWNNKNKSHILSTYEILLDAGVTQIDALGTCLEYGNLTGSVSERTIGSEISDFGICKLEILQKLSEWKIGYRWYRCFYVIGVGQHPNSLIRTAIDKIGRGESFSPRSPRSSFDYISVDDVACGITLAINQEVQSGVYNVGSGVSLSTNALTNIVKRFYGRTYEELQVDSGLVADSSKLFDATGWTPVHSIEKTVIAMINEYQAR